VKELGVVISQNTLVTDLEKIFDLYWYLTNRTVMPPLPPSLDTIYNLTNPAHVLINGVNAKLFFAASPVTFNTPSRTNDIDALIWNIDNAHVNVFGSVMDYSPFTLYTPPTNPLYWPILDDALRSAAFRGVQVHLLFSIWDDTPTSTIQYMRSLNELDNIMVKVMRIPAFSGADIPHARVNQASYLVTEASAYITTSNWTPDYFLAAGGVSLTWTNLESQRALVQQIFSRDWESVYAFQL